ncbi:MAG: Ppx/GppA family phosphatase [Synergistaceae bacterium]|nr:Ppx/GppA family phosphatase [Synergistaceae bacterium]
MAAIIKAVIDVGTNSAKLLVMERSNLTSRVLADTLEIVRLGEGTAESGVLSDEAMKRSSAVISDMARAARSLGAEEISAVGTQAMRMAANADLFIEAVKSACGVEIRVISGDEEAELSFAAAVAGLRGQSGDFCVLDVGGGSSEITLGDRSSVAYRRSVPIGALSFFKKFFDVVPDGGPVPQGTLDEAASFAESEILNAGARRDVRMGRALCVGIGGTVSTLAAVSRGDCRDDAGGDVLSADEISRQIALYASMSLDARKKVKGLPPERADIILPGACIVREFLTHFGWSEMTVCARGLRYGVMEKIM